MASPCALPPQWREYGEGLNGLMPDISQTYGRLFFTHEVVRGSNHCVWVIRAGSPQTGETKEKEPSSSFGGAGALAFVQNPALSRIMIYATLADVEALLRATLQAPSFRPLLAWHLIGETPLPPAPCLLPHYPQTKLGFKHLATPDRLDMYVLEGKLYFSLLLEGTHPMKPGLTRIFLTSTTYGTEFAGKQIKKKSNKQEDPAKFKTISSYWGFNPQNSF